MPWVLKSPLCVKETGVWLCVGVGISLCSGNFKHWEYSITEERLLGGTSSSRQVQPVAQSQGWLQLSHSCEIRASSQLQKTCNLPGHSPCIYLPIKNLLLTSLLLLTLCTADPENGQSVSLWPAVAFYQFEDGSCVSPLSSPPPGTLEWISPVILDGCHQNDSLDSLQRVLTFQEGCCAMQDTVLWQRPHRYSMKVHGRT